jgi:long-chain acyl-CoA synthetase
VDPVVSEAPALRHCQRNRWITLTWSQVQVAVARLAEGWRSLGLERGDRVLFAAGARPRALLSLLAVRAAGATPLVVEPRVEPGPLAELLASVSVRFAFADGDEQADALLPTAIERIVYDQPRGLAWRRDPRLVSCDELELPADALPEEDPAPVELARPSDEGWRLALLHPEPRRYVPAGLTPLAAHDTALLAEVLAEPASLALVVGRWLGERHELVLPETPDGVLGELARLRPTYLSGSAMFFESLRAHAALRSGAPGGWRRRLIERALRRPESLLARLLVLAPLRRVLGLGRVRQAVAAGTPAAETRAFFQALGISVIPTVAVATVALAGRPARLAAGSAG